MVLELISNKIEGHFPSIIEFNQKKVAAQITLFSFELLHQE